MFVAVRPPAAAIAALDADLEPLRQLPGAPRWTPPDRWHVTLAFLGAVPDELTGPLTGALSRAVAGTPALRLRLSGTGAFGSGRRSRVCWVGLTGQVPELVALAARITAAAGGVGIAADGRPLRPHLTVGRWGGGPGDDDPVARLAPHDGPAWPVTRVELVRSHLGPPLRHETVTAWPVGHQA